VVVSTLANPTRTKTDTNALDPTDIANAAAEIFVFLDAIS